MTKTLVKSAGRVLEILEFFREIRRPATVMEIARAVRIPQSSASALMQTLVMLGYVDIDAALRSYVPTARVTLLGAWLSAPLVEDGPLIRMLDALAEETGEHILLASLNGLLVRYIHSVPARLPGRPVIRSGTLRPLGRSGVGNLFLAMRPDGQIARLVRRVNAEELDPAYRIALPDLMREIAETRARGYAVALDKVAAGVGGVNVPLPRLPRMQPMAVSLSSLSVVVTGGHAGFFAQMQQAVRQHLGMDIPSIAPQMRA